MLLFSCCLLTLFEITSSKNYFRNTIGVSNALDPDQDLCSVNPDLAPNCLHRLTATRIVAAWKEIAYVQIH